MMKKLSLAPKVLLISCIFLQAYCLHPQNTSSPFTAGAETGILQDDGIAEASGLAASHTRNDYYWTHNDSGDSARLFLIGKNGSSKGIVHFNEFVLDCEDIASGIGAAKGKYVYLGDIGDNFHFRPFVNLYIFKEDSLLYTIDKKLNYIQHYTKVTLKYEDGPKDAEALMIDPVDSLLYIISKREKNVGIYTASLKELFTQATVVLKKMGTTVHTRITAGDISADGSEVIIRNYDNLFYWKRQKGEPVYETLQRPAIQLDYKKEKQGEAVCFAADHSGILTTSEGKYAPVYFYKRK